MLRRVLSVAIVLLPAGFLSAQSHLTEQQAEVIEWVTRSLIQEQKSDWDDWSTSTDRRVVLLADETIPFPAFVRDDHGLRYELETLKTERRDLYRQLRTTSIVALGAWKPTPPTQCGNEAGRYPHIEIVPAKTLARTFTGKALEASAALAIRMSTPVFSKNGRSAAVYAEAVGSHVENSRRQLIVLTRRKDRPGEWDAMIRGDQLFATARPMPHEREINSTDHEAMTAALQWLVTQRGEFDLVPMADSVPRPTEWRRQQRKSGSSFEIAEAALAQLSRRNSEYLVFDTSIFSIKGVRNLNENDNHVWSRPSVLISLPAYDNDTAILTVTYRTADDGPRAFVHLLLMRRSGKEWSVVWNSVQEFVIIS